MRDSSLCTSTWCSNRLSLGFRSLHDWASSLGKESVVSHCLSGQFDGSPAGLGPSGPQVHLQPQCRRRTVRAQLTGLWAGRQFLDTDLGCSKQPQGPWLLRGCALHTLASLHLVSPAGVSTRLLYSLPGTSLSGLPSQVRRHLSATSPRPLLPGALAADLAVIHSLGQLCPVPSAVLCSLARLLAKLRWFPLEPMPSVWRLPGLPSRPGTDTWEPGGSPGDQAKGAASSLCLPRAGCGYLTVLSASMF